MKKNPTPVVLMAEFPVTLTHPDKMLWPEAGITKSGYLSYLTKMAPYLLDHLAERPLTMIRYPHGVNGHSFYQKDAPPGIPGWVRTVPIWSSEKNRHLQGVIVDSVAALLWLGNLGCLEFHVGFVTVDHPDEPTCVAIDIDPSVPGFEPVREVALVIHELLGKLNLPHVAKTSGATGIQIFIPLTPGHDFESTRVFTKSVADYAQERLPNVVTLERLTKNRGTKVYVDYPQHGHNRTLIAAYSPRATHHATVSTPLTFGELARGAVPDQFTLHTVPERVRQIGDLMTKQPPANLHEVVSFLRRHPAGRL